MKRSIKWHEGCLENMKASEERLIEVWQRAGAAAHKARREIELRELQINEAKAQGKDGFDSERFLIKKAENASN